MGRGTHLATELEMSRYVSCAPAERAASMSSGDEHSIQLGAASAEVSGARVAVTSPNRVSVSNACCQGRCRLRAAVFIGPPVLPANSRLHRALNVHLSTSYGTVICCIGDSHNGARTERHEVGSQCTVHIALQRYTRTAKLGQRRRVQVRHAGEYTQSCVKWYARCEDG